MEAGIKPGSEAKMGHDGLSPAIGIQPAHKFPKDRKAEPFVLLLALLCRRGAVLE